MGADLAEAAVDLADPFRRHRVLRLFEQTGSLDIGGEDRVQQAPVAAGGFLRNGGDVRTTWNPGLPAIGFDLAHDQAQQRRLSGAIAPDQGDPRAHRDRCRDPIEHDATTDAIAQFVDHEHDAGTFDRLRGRGNNAVAARA